MGLVTIDLNNFDEDNPANIVLVGRLAWCNGFEQCKACRKR